MATERAKTWQEYLEGLCSILSITRLIVQPSAKIEVSLHQSIKSPVTAEVSFRSVARCQFLSCTGGRTAWSATVNVQGQSLPARWWYDGQFINNAKEDAAEVASTWLRTGVVLQAPPSAAKPKPAEEPIPKRKPEEAKADMDDEAEA